MSPIAPRILDILVSYFLNIFSRVDNPRHALEHFLPGDEKLVGYYIAEWTKLERTDLVLFGQLHAPEVGNLALREWLSLKWSGRHKFRPHVVIANPNRLKSRTGRRPC